MGNGNVAAADALDPVEDKNSSKQARLRRGVETGQTSESGQKPADSDGEKGDFSHSCAAEPPAPPVFST